MGYLERMLTDFVPQEKVKSYKARFISRIPVHAAPVCTGRVVAIEDSLATIELVMALGDGTVVVRGQAVVDVG
jgi:hypothetical protein